MVTRAAEPRRSASSSCAEPKIRRKSLVRKLPSLVAAIAVIAFIHVLRMIVDRNNSELFGLSAAPCSLPDVCRASGDPARKSRSGSKGVSASVPGQHESLDGQH